MNSCVTAGGMDFNFLENLSPATQSFICTFIIGVVPVFILPLLPCISNFIFASSAPIDQKKENEARKKGSKDRSKSPLKKLESKEDLKPLLNQPVQSRAIIHPVLLNILLCFAAGGLLGDVFLHLIPHSIEPALAHSHSELNSGCSAHADSAGHHHHDTGHASLAGLHILLGIFVFLLIEKAGRHFSCCHSHSKKEKQASMQISGMLNLIADATHNFTDGLAIAASFFKSTQLGISTSLAILIHEIPHEVGDYAILLQSGMSHWKAILLQFVTAIGALMGTALGVALQNGFDLTIYGPFSIKSQSFNADWIIPFTAGGFMYVALATILPEVNESSASKGAKQSLLELLSFMVGVALMMSISDH